MHLASKLKDTIPITGDKLVMYTDYSIALQDLKDMELLVLHKLNWDLSTVTAHDFIEQIIYRLPSVFRNDIIEIVKRHTKTFIALANTEYIFTHYPPSLQAAACINAAIAGLLGKDVVTTMKITENLCETIKCDLVWLNECQVQIEQKLNESVHKPSDECSTPPAHSAQHTKTSENDTDRLKSQHLPSTPTDMRDIVF